MAMIMWLKNGTSSKVYGNIGISKIEFFNFLGLKGFNKIKKKLNHLELPYVVHQLLFK